MQLHKWANFMADITHPVEYNEEQKSLVQRKLDDPNFHHTDWSADDLAELRSAIRHHYRSEQDGLCAYCKNPVSVTSVMNCHVEHIAPKSIHREFIFEEKNLCVICADCNEIKRDQETSAEVHETIANASGRKFYPRSSAAFLIVHPHFDDWSDHIEKLGSYYCDKTKKGWFTIGICVLNRSLRKFGWQPALTREKKIRELMNLYLDEQDPLKRSQSLRRLMDQLI